MIHVGKHNEISDLSGDLLSPEAPQQQVLTRVLESATFRRCPRLREFLEYVALRALNDQSDEVTEQRIGEEVFGRTGRFNPAEDNIVRATARSLRAKLRDYYDTEGAFEALRIEIPKGTYLPHFVAARPNAGSSAKFRERPQSKWRWVLAAFALCAGIAAAWLAVDNQRLRVQGQGTANDSTLLSVLLGPGTAANIIASDGLHHYLQDLRGELTELEAYATHEVFAPLRPEGTASVAPELWQLIRDQRLTNSQDVRSAIHLAQHLGRGRLVKFQHARSVSMETLQMGENLILLGGRRANPWVGLFEQDLDFQMEFSSSPGLAEIRNRNPRRGESAVYTTEINEQQTGQAYGRVALVPGLSRKGKVLLIAGTNGDATLAACDVLLQPRMLEEVRRLLGKQPDPSLARLEILIETSAIGGGTKDFRIIAIH